jgi:hypothetical protein
MQALLDVLGGRPCVLCWSTARLSCANRFSFPLPLDRAPSRGAPRQASGDGLHSQSAQGESLNVLAAIGLQPIAL